MLLAPCPAVCLAAVHLAMLCLSRVTAGRGVASICQMMGVACVTPRRQRPPPPYSGAVPRVRRVPFSLRDFLVIPASTRPGRSLHRRWCEALASFPLMALGVALLLRSDIGSSPYDALNTGLAETLGVPLAAAMIGVAASAMIIGIALGGPVGPLTFVTVGVLGLLVDVVYGAMPTVELLLPRVLMFAVGLVLTVGGVALQVNAEVGPGAGEVLMLGVVNQGISVRAAKWAIDAAVLVVGVVLGGLFGLGTAVMLVAFAPMLAQTLRILGYVPPSAAAAGSAAGDVVEPAPVGSVAPGGAVVATGSVPVISAAPMAVPAAMIPFCD